MTSEFWLYRWIDEYKVTKVEQAESLLRPGRRASQRLIELADDASEAKSAVGKFGKYSMVAGRGIDLSGELDCNHRECLRKRVDSLFERVLHYFDNVVVSGLSSKGIVERFEKDGPNCLDIALEHIATLLYLRKIGVADFLVFQEKPPPCGVHYSEHAREVGMLDLIESVDYWADFLSRDGVVSELHSCGGHCHFTFQHPYLEISRSGKVAGGSPGIRDIAEEVFRWYAANLVSDARAAKSVGAPLGSSIRLHEEVLSMCAQPKNGASVAFDMKLPVLREASIRDIVRLRQNERECFDKFSAAVKVAIDQRVSDVKNAEQVASDVVADVVDPALADIGRRLKVAKRTFTKKAGVSVSVGAATVTVGLMAAAPVIVGAGVAAMATSIPALHKLLEDRGSVEISDMYFLWKLRASARKTRSVSSGNDRRCKY